MEPFLFDMAHLLLLLNSYRFDVHVYTVCIAWLSVGECVAVVVLIPRLNSLGRVSYSSEERLALCLCSSETECNGLLVMKPSTLNHYSDVLYSVQLKKKRVLILQTIQSASLA